jgi:hypothetical protein
MRHKMGMDRAQPSGRSPYFADGMRRIERSRQLALGLAER